MSIVIISSSIPCSRFASQVRCSILRNNIQQKVCQNTFMLIPVFRLMDTKFYIFFQAEKNLTALKRKFCKRNNLSYHPLIIVCFIFSLLMHVLKMLKRSRLVLSRTPFLFPQDPLIFTLFTCLCRFQTFLHFAHNKLNIMT